MFSINDTVLYGTDGVCSIADITTKDVAGKSSEYYVLKPVYQAASTIFVPMNNEKLMAKMRRILTLDEINCLITEMPDEEDIWIDDDTKRRQKYREIVASGDRKMMIRLIRTLCRLKQEQQLVKKRLHKADESFLNEAERLLYDEFALVLKIEQDQVVPFITGQLELNDVAK